MSFERGSLLPRTLSSHYFSHHQMATHRVGTWSLIIPYNRYYFLQGYNFCIFMVKWNPRKLTSTKFDSYPDAFSFIDSCIHEARHCYNSHPAETVLQTPRAHSLSLRCCLVLYEPAHSICDTSPNAAKGAIHSYNTAHLDKILR